MANENIVVERDTGVGIITLNRPKVLNALSRALLQELDDAVTELEEDEDVGAIVITGAGDRAFSAGADIHEMAREGQDPDSGGTDPVRERWVWHIAACKKPTIGAINGLAYGGGAVLASSLDIRVGSDKASFRFLGASYGRVNSTWTLPMQIGWPAAKELLFTARVVEAREAHRLRLLDHVVASDQLMLKALELGKQIAANNSGVVQGIKEILLANIGAAWDEMYGRELEARTGKLKPPPITVGFKDFLERKGQK